MPIYEYICESCEEELEVIQKISDEPLSICPSCNNPSLKKKTSMSAFHLKGGGWYKDGYGESTSNGSTTKSSTDTSVTVPATDSAKDNSSTATTTKTEKKPAATSSAAPTTKAS